MKHLPAPAAVTDLVWVQTGFIGDIILTTAAIELAHERLPGARQHVITTKVGALALAGSRPLVSRIVFDKAGGNVLGAFRAVRRELAAALPRAANAVLLQTHRSHRSSLLSRYLGLPTLTYDEAGFAVLATVRVPRVAVLHEAARIGLLLEPLGVPRTAIVAARPALASLPLETAGGGWQARLAGHPGRAIGIAPGSVWGTKRWTPEGFAGLLAGLLSYGDALIVLIGSAAEATLAADLQRALPPERVLNLAGVTSLDDLRRVFPRLTLLVSNDSSPIHYASAFAVPTVALFGATVPGMGFGPLAPRSVSLGVELPCRPCSDHGPVVCPLDHFKCMRELQVATVLSACKAALAPL